MPNARLHLPPKKSAFNSQLAEIGIADEAVIDPSRSGLDGEAVMMLLEPY